ncbi:hypothetical protein N7512_005169 [Penicillium capsulatum]|nr:hypothetical protein N7512_005169 [Penicillium capsulatum]
MRPIPKPDASYASNRLTRANRPARHLLSNFNQPKSDSDDNLTFYEDEPTDKNSKEPGTDDEPLSSSDEASDDDTPNERKTLEAKLADGDRESQSSSAPGAGPSSQKSALARTSSAAEDLLFSSQTSKAKRRRKDNTYPSRTHSTSFSKTPTSSARSAPSSIKKSQSQAMEDDNTSDESDSESGFKMPIDIPSPQKLREEPSGFKMPPTFPTELTSNSSLGTDSSKNPPLWTPRRFQLARDSKSETNGRPASPPRKALCPMCKAEVDPALLVRFEAQPRQRIREQQQFCASHQRDTAEKEWSAHGYPAIQWDQLDARVRKYFPEIEKLLIPDCHSYYRNILVTSNQSGQSKNFRLTLAGDALETISCGYYGTRGSQKMLEAVMDRFSVKMGRLAKFDPIIQKAGPAVYAQSVLVPELAVRLVKEDMNVDDDAARQILRESIKLGEKVNPAPDDVVPIPENEVQLVE